jgi:hypothetical protein
LKCFLITVRIIVDPYYCLKYSFLFVHRRTQVGGRVNIGPPAPQANFTRLVNKNAIKSKIRGPPLVILPESLVPPGILAKTRATLNPRFSTSVHLCVRSNKSLLWENFRKLSENCLPRFQYISMNGTNQSISSTSKDLLVRNSIFKIFTTWIKC